MNRIDDILNSLDVLQPATPAPHLHTRVLAALQKTAQLNTPWSRALAFVTRPSVALAAVLLLVILNTFALYINHTTTQSSAVVLKAVGNKEDFVINVASMYDTENLEP